MRTLFPEEDLGGLRLELVPAPDRRWSGTFDLSVEQPPTPPTLEDFVARENACTTRGTPEFEAWLERHQPAT